MPKLVIRTDAPQALEFELKPGSNYLGRGFSNDFKIEDPSVSSSHAQVILDGDVIMVRDLGSTNGTFINRSQVKEGYLQPGQTLHLGAVEFSLIDAQVTTSAPAPSASLTAAASGPVAASFVSSAPPPLSPTKSAPAAPAGLRISRPVASSPPSTADEAEEATPAPPLPPRVMGGTVAAPAGKSNCKFHPKAPGRWLCPKCQQLFCDLCISTRDKPGGKTAHLCRSCGVECSPVAYKPVLKPIDTGGFYQQLPSAFVYPFQKDRKFILIGAIVCYIIVWLIRTYIPLVYGRWTALALFLGYWYSFLISIIHTTAHGDDNDPSLPEPSNFREDLLSVVYRMFASTALCFLPVWGLLLWKFFEPDGPISFALIGAMLPLCCLYYPMALLAVAIFESVAGVNPMVVMPAVFKMPVQYIVACVLFGMVLGFYYVGAFLLPIAIPIPVLPAAISSAVWLYFMVVLARVLGLLYYDNRGELGWLSHHH